MNSATTPVRPPARVVSAQEKVLGSATLGLVFCACTWLVLELCGNGPAAWLGIQIGSFLGLVSLVIEIALVERSARTFHAQGVQTTFMSFILRIATVAPLTLLFMKAEIGVDSQAFAVSYCGTFFLYLCWLAWETYHAPVAYRPRGRTTQGEGIVVKDNRRPQDVLCAAHREGVR